MPDTHLKAIDCFDFIIPVEAPGGIVEVQAFDCVAVIGLLGCEGIEDTVGLYGLSDPPNSLSIQEIFVLPSLDFNTVDGHV